MEGEVTESYAEGCVAMYNLFVRNAETYGISSPQEALELGLISEDAFADIIIGMDIVQGRDPELNLDIDEP